LQVTEKAKHYGISKLLAEPVDPANSLVLQYELKLSNGLTCGGAYLKFVTADEAFTPSGLKDDTPYSVMFGPDKCGSTNKVITAMHAATHVIGKHRNSIAACAGAVKAFRSIRRPFDSCGGYSSPACRYTSSSDTRAPRLERLRRST
jgi:hypothetical protein